MNRLGRAWVKSHRERTGSRRVLVLWVSLGILASLMVVLRQRTGERTLGESAINATQLEPAHPLPPRGTYDLPTALMKLVRDDELRLTDDGAWKEFWTHLERIVPGTLASSSLGEIAYAQLKHQPDVYRGRIVTVTGVVRRAEPFYGSVEGLERVAGSQRSAAGESQADGKLSTDEQPPHVWQLWLEPVWGPPAPIVVCCRELPKGFPTGAVVNAPVRCHGYFYKRWAYRAQDRIRTAPVVLSLGCEWTPPAPSDGLAPDKDLPSWHWGPPFVVGVLGVATAVALFRSGRPSRRGISQRSFRDAQVLTPSIPPGNDGTDRGEDRDDAFERDHL